VDSWVLAGGLLLFAGAAACSLLLALGGGGLVVAGGVAVACTYFYFLHFSLDNKMIYPLSLFFSPSQPLCSGFSSLGSAMTV
jgi:hypothetical protein